MGRSYNADAVRNAAAALRCVKDDPFLGCDIIAGFPGESEADFAETYELCREIGFAWIHVFPYSKRPGTQAFSYPEAVAEKEITKRAQALTDLARRGRADYIRRWLGRQAEVLIENSRAKTACRGVSENYRNLLVQYKGGKAPPAGTVLTCRLLEERKADIHNRDFDAIAEEV
jgi:threonylcarbamoyladenosine tRNA methylthiotransferase MtaB